MKLPRSLSRSNRFRRIRHHRQVEQRRGRMLRQLRVEGLEDRRLLAAVAVFDDPAFVDTGNTAADESDNIQASVAAHGHTVNTFTGTSEADFEGAFSTSEILVIPELTNGDLSAALSPGAISEILQFVSSGGGLVVAGTGPFATGIAEATHDVDFLNTVFGFSITDSGDDGGAGSALTGAEAGTAFAGGPATLASNSGTSDLLPASLPAGAASIYEESGESTVALMPFGQGQIVYLGWDWFNSDPPNGGGQDGNWQEVLDRALTQVTPTDAVIDGTAGDDEFIVQRNAADNGVVEVLINGVVVQSYPFSTLDSLTIRGLEGNDQLTVDSSQGLLNLPDGIRFDGGAGVDLLILAQTDGPTLISSTINVGASPGSGRSVVRGPAEIQSVHFENIEPVVDALPAPTLFINGTAVGSLLNADNAINYTSSDLFGPTWGKVTVDNFEPIHFTNKDNLNIDAEAGSDEINLNHPSNPVGFTPGGLKNINVDGDDPVASDRLTVFDVGGGTPINYTSARRTAGATATITGAQVPAVNARTVETIHIEGQGGNDTLTVNATANPDIITVTPGSFLDSGSILVAEETGIGLGLVEHVPLTFANLGQLGGVTLDGGGASDVLVYNGTSADDTFDVAATTGTVNLDSNLGQHLEVRQTDVESLTLVGLAGDDTIGIGAPQPYTNIKIQGGEPSESDVLNLFGRPAVAETLRIEPDSSNPTRQNITGLGTPIGVSGTELITYAGTGADDTLIVDPGDGDNTVRVDNATTGDRVTSDTLPSIGFVGLDIFRVVAPGFDEDRVTFNLTTLVGAANYETDLGANDTLVVEGLDGTNDFFRVTNPAVGSVAVELGGIRLTDIGSLGRLHLDGQGGDDRVTVDVDGADSIPVPITFDGGLGSDQLIVLGTPSTPFDLTAYRLGPQIDAGRLEYIVGGEPVLEIDFIGLEPVIDLVPSPTLVVDGTNADNAINYTQSDINPAWGKVSVDGFEPMHFANKANLTLNGLAGDDTINLNNPTTPTGLTEITVDGGDPTASDKVIVNGTTGADAIVVDQFTKDGARITGAQPVPVTVETTEHLAIVGQGGGDALTVLGTADDDTIVHTPGEGLDEGTVRVNQLLGLSYESLGIAAGASLTVDGADGNDTLVVEGTISSDVFKVAATSGATTLTVPTGNRLPVEQIDVENLTLDGREGDDRFEIQATQPYETINVLGGGPGASDVLTVNGAFGTDEVFTVDPAPVPSDGTVVIDGLPTNYAGVEHVFLAGNDGDSDSVTILDDLGDNIWDVSAGTLLGDRVQIEGRESINIDDFDAVELRNRFGSDVFNIHPTQLVSFSSSFTVTGDAGLVVDDVLRLHGTEVNDLVTSNADTVFVNDQGITAGTGLAVIQVLTLGGSDTIDLDLDLPDVRKRVEAGAGNDTVDMSDAVDADIFGGDGDDFLVGTDDSDFIDGGRGNDTILGRGGIDTLYGGEGNDIVIGGVGNDLIFGGAGSDILVWNPGDNNDLMEGGEGRDMLQFVGGAGNDDFALSADGSRLRFERQPGDVVLDVGGVEEVDVDTSVTFTGRLDQAQEVPAPAATAAEGTVAMVYDSDTNTFSIDIFVKGITQADLSASHIHAEAPGVPGGVIFGLGGGAAWTPEAGGLRRTITGATFPEANIADLLAGNTYVNVHTPLNPAGEIRGQLNLSDDVVPPPTRPTPALVGADAFVVHDLFTTDVEMVNVGLGANNGGLDDGAADTVDVHGRSVADDLNIATTASQAGFADFVNVVGLAYDVRVSNAVAAQDDRLTVFGNEGDDRLKAEPGVEDTVLITLDGGNGDDFLSADAILIGGPGDDFLEGGAGDDSLFGGPGEDTMVGGGGQDTYDGGLGFDAILIRGTAGADSIDVRQSAAGVLEYTVTDQFGTLSEDATTASGTEDVIVSVEGTRVEAGDGGDTIRLAIADALHEDGVANSLRISVDGGDDGASDRLAVVDVATPDLSILRQSFGGLSGSVEIGPGFVGTDEAFLHLFTGIEFVQVVADDLAPTAPVNVEDPTIANRLVVFKDDAGEANNDRRNATHLGAGTTVNIDPTIDPGPGAFGLPADTDWYRVEALVSGTLDFQIFFEQVAAVGARPGLPGSGDLNITAFDESGDAIANFTTSDDDDDNERVRIPAVQGEIYSFQVVGDGGAINAYDVSVINLPAATPSDLELDDQPVGDPPPLNSDTGRSQHDNVTRDDTPTVILRLDDALFLNDLPGNDTPGTPLGDDPIAIPFRPGPMQPTAPGYAIAIFDEGDTPGGPAVEEPQTPLGFATMVEPGVYQFTTPTLVEGSHFLTARVQMIDPADPTQTGFGPRSASLEVIVDTTPPPVSLGQPGDPDDGLLPDSDTGVSPPNPHTIDDLVTSDTTPTFWGRAEANTIVRLYADLDDDGVLDVGTDLFLGQDTAIPLDGTEQEPDGYWEIRSVVELNDEAFFPIPDGTRTIFVTAEDVAGNVNAPVGAADTLEIFVDTVGPVIESVFITDMPGYDLFDPKPVTDGPTPRVDSLTITFTDLPDRAAPDFLFDALKQDVAEHPGHYRLVGDHNGVIAIDAVIVTNLATADGQPAEARVELQFAQPLPDDRFSLIVSDSIVDPVGNALDGESNAVEPQETPLLPSGDGIRGGDFVARFTVDSRPEFGSISQGLVYVDINGNFVFDPEGKDNDATNRDFVYQFGLISDAHFAGNFADATTGVASGFDKLGVYGLFNGRYSFLIDTDDDGVGDLPALMPLAHQVNGIPVAGDFSPAGDGDEFGVFDGEAWYLDLNGNQQIDVGERIATNYNGLPLVGDFNGDGEDDLAVYNNDTNTFIFDTNRDGTADSIWEVRDDMERFMGLSGFTDRPVAGDLNLDGIDDIGLWVKGRQGILPKEAGEFFFWVSDGAAADPADVFNAFSPSPLGNDLFAQFGDESSLPIFGNFDPPVSAAGSQVPRNFLNNAANTSDVNNDGLVTALDALLVINALNQGLEFSPNGQSARMLAMTNGRMVDTNNDGLITPSDALRVINSLNRALTTSSAEAEAEESRDYTAAVDLVFAAPDDDDQMRWLADDLERFRIK